MTMIHLPDLELPLLSYILAANLLTIFLVHGLDHKIIKEFIFYFVYLTLIVSTLLIFFSAAIHEEYLEIGGIILVICSYFIAAFILAFITYYWLKTAVGGMLILRAYKRDVKEE